MVVITVVGLIAVAYASADNSKEPNVDISDYFRLNCEGSLPKQEVSVFQQEIRPGFEMDLGSFELKGIEGGKLNMSADGDHTKVSLDDTGKTYIEQNGFRYDISSKKGINGGTEVTIGRSCERR